MALLYHWKGENNTLFYGAYATFHLVPSSFHKSAKYPTLKCVILPFSTSRSLQKNQILVCSIKGEQWPFELTNHSKARRHVTETRRGWLVSSWKGEKTPLYSVGLLISRTTPQSCSLRLTAIFRVAAHSTLVYRTHWSSFFVFITRRCSSAVLSRLLSYASQLEYVFSLLKIVYFFVWRLHRPNFPQFICRSCPVCSTSITTTDDRDCVISISPFRSFS